MRVHCTLSPFDSLDPLHHISKNVLVRSLIVHIGPRWSSSPVIHITYDHLLISGGSHRRGLSLLQRCDAVLWLYRQRRMSLVQQPHHGLTQRDEWLAIQPVVPFGDTHISRCGIGNHFVDHLERTLSPVAVMASTPRHALLIGVPLVAMRTVKPGAIFAVKQLLELGRDTGIPSNRGVQRDVPREVDCGIGIPRRFKREHGQFLFALSHWALWQLSFVHNLDPFVPKVFGGALYTNRMVAASPMHDLCGDSLWKFGKAHCSLNVDRTWIHGIRELDAACSVQSTQRNLAQITHIQTMAERTIEEVA